MRKVWTRVSGVLVSLVLAMPGLVGTAVAAPSVNEVAPARSWANLGNPYVFALGDSVMDGCVLATKSGGGLGLGYRDLGHVTWPGATTTMMRERLQGRGSWPAWTVTEGSNEMERIWFRDAGALLVALGTNDVKTMPVEQYAADVEWFVAQSRGRPLVWLTSHNPPFRRQTDVFNAKLREIAKRYANLKVLEWDAFLDANPQHVRGDGVHPADGAACDAYNRLIAGAMAGEIGRDQPRGYWYGSVRYPDGIIANGWAAAWSNPRQHIPRVNVRIDWKHYDNLPITATSAHGDHWADAASGRHWWVRLPTSAAGRYVCVDILDPVGRWTSLGCRTV